MTWWGYIKILYVVERGFGVHLIILILRMCDSAVTNK